MAHPIQATPTVQANLNGSSTTVNLRDYLNTRVSPFLKRAVIDSLDAEAQYPLQWLGEQLILQSITYEGNPDSTNIRERFLYKHEIEPKAAAANSSAVVPPPEDQPQIEHSNAPQSTEAVVAQSIAEPPAPASSIETPIPGSTAEPTEQFSTATAAAVNGIVQQPGTPGPAHDTEMSNAP